MKKETPTFYLQAHFCIYKKLGKKRGLVVLIILTKYVKVSLLHQLWLNIVKEEKKF